MRLFTKDTDYAIRALSCIASSQAKVVTVKDLSAKLDLPRPFLRKILQSLTSAGILTSSKGSGGGFSLAVSPRSISVLDVLEIFQGKFRLNEHVFRGKLCPVMKTCRLKVRLDGIEDRMLKDLGSIKILSLI